MKVCSKCKQEKPFEEFSKKASSKDGYRSHCKDCCKQYREQNKERILEQRKQYREQNKERILEQRKQHYEQNKERILERNKQYREQNKEHYREYFKQWREQNKERILEYRKQHYEQNKEQIKEQNKQYREQNKEHYREYFKQYREQNKERILEYRKQYYDQNKEQIKEQSKQYSRTPPGKFSAYKTNAKKRGIEFHLTMEQFESFWQKPCEYCGAEIETIGLDRVDSDGHYTIDNVVSCCWPCNESKGKKTLEEWNKILDNKKLKLKEK
jgi:exonuclease VII large subunit